MVAIKRYKSKMRTFKEIHVRRPVLWLAVAYIGGILIAYRFCWGSLVLWWAAAAFLLFVAQVAVYRSRWSFVVVLLVFSILGILNTKLRLNQPDMLEIFEDKDIIVQGTVVHFQTGEDKDVYTVKTGSVIYDGHLYPVEQKIYVTVYHNTQGESLFYSQGDRLKIKGKIEKPAGRRNPGGFDFEAYLLRRGIRKVMYVSACDVKFVEKVDLPIYEALIYKCKSKVGEVFDRYVGDKQGNLLKAMILGERWLLPSQVRENFSKAGLAHILAISGLHVGFVALMLTHLTKVIGLGRKWAFFVQTGFLFFYCVLAGATPSVIRATVMAVVLLGGGAVARKADSLNSLAIAAFVILLFRPLDILEVGFQMSFAAVAGIIFLYRLIYDRLRRVLIKSVASALSVTVAAQLGVCPLIAYYFNIFSPFSIVSNLLFVPVAGLVVIMGFLLVPVALVIWPMAELVGWVIRVLCTVLIQGNEFICSVPGAFFPVISPSLLFLFCYYFILWIFSSERPVWVIHPVLWCGAAAALFLIVVLFNFLVPGDLKVVFVDVGQGDCIYIRTPDRKNILIDGGGRPKNSPGDFDVGEDIVVPFLLKNGVSCLDVVVMSHCHDDHIGGLIPVIKTLPVKAFMEYPPICESEKYRELKELVNTKGIQTFQVHSGDSLRIGRYVWIDVLYPDADGKVLKQVYDDNENNCSLVLLLKYKDATVLFPGDIEAGVENYLSGWWRQPIDILKVPHHGSNTSSTEKWMEAIKPKVGIIQVGRNFFGHPDLSVLARLKKQGVKIFRTDRHGAVICLFHSGNWKIKWMVHDE